MDFSERFGAVEVGTNLTWLWASAVGVGLALIVGAVVWSLRRKPARSSRDSRAASVPLVAGIVATLAIGVTAWWALHVEAIASRRALQARLDELRSEAARPGSALACLDSVELQAVEEQCETTLFANPQTVNAALAHTDARLSLLAALAETQPRGAPLNPGLQWVRRALEADRYGFVAHVVNLRGCSSEKCIFFKLLQDPDRVRVNVRDRVFDNFVNKHSAAWRSAQPPVASGGGQAAPQPEPPPPLLAAPRPPLNPKDRPNFPTASSIPILSILKPEPPLAPAGADTSGRSPEEAARASASSRATAPPPRQQQSPPEPAARGPLQIVPQ